MVERLSTLAGARGTRSRSVGFAILVASVLIGHGWLTGEIADRAAAFEMAARLPPRIEVTYVRELEPTAPPPVAPQTVAAPAPVARTAAAPTRAASQPRKRADGAQAAQAASMPKPAPPVEPAEAPALPPVLASAVEAAPPEPIPPLPASQPEPAVAQAPSEPAAATASAAAGAGSAAGSAAVASPAASAVAFEWPGSTRLTYELIGNWRGEVKGDATVEWVRQGAHYQVHLDVRIGAPFAPLFTRRMSSDGELTAEGLVPKRYDQESKLVFKSRDLATVTFEPDAVVLSNGQRRERMPGMQDTASQFVQLAWLYSTRPELLQVGQTVEVPLALPRNTYRIVYDVVGEEPVQTPFGLIPAFHLKPRRMDMKGDLRVEIWFAPQLRYLPARIRIEQDANVFIDLALSRKPELAAN